MVKLKLQMSLYQDITTRDYVFVCDALLKLNNWKGKYLKFNYVLDRNENEWPFMK